MVVYEESASTNSIMWLTTVPTEPSLQLSTALVPVMSRTVNCSTAPHVVVMVKDSCCACIQSGKKPNNNNKRDSVFFIFI